MWLQDRYRNKRLNSKGSLVTSQASLMRGGEQSFHVTATNFVSTWFISTQIPTRALSWTSVHMLADNFCTFFRHLFSGFYIEAQLPSLSPGTGLESTCHLDISGWLCPLGKVLCPCPGSDLSLNIYNVLSPNRIIYFILFSQIYWGNIG